jgi:hypothetical protein
MRTPLAATALGLTLILALLAGTADAREARQRSGAISTGNHSARYEQNVDRSRGNYNRSTKLTGEKGKTAERDVGRTWDRKSGTGTYNSSTTTARGTSSTTGTVKKEAPGSFSNSGTTTTKNGKTIEHSGTTTKNEDGSWTHTGTQTGSNSQTRTGTSTTVKTEDGRTTTGSYNNSNGGSGSYTKGVTRTEDGVRKTDDGSRVTAKGRNWSRAAESNRKDGVVDYSTTVTDPKGEAHTKSGQVVITPDKPISTQPVPVPTM